MIAIDHDSALRARLASTCALCGVGGWHPEARSCQFQNCSLSVVSDSPLVADGVSGAGADLPSLGSAPVFPADTDSLFHAPEIAL